MSLYSRDISASINSQMLSIQEILGVVPGVVVHTGNSTHFGNGGKRIMSLRVSWRKRETLPQTQNTTASWPFG
jgi:hypothetical protein